MENPIEVFKSLWLAARTEGASQHRNAVCVSTIDQLGYPNSRFVDLKDVDGQGFVFCTSLDSAKALDIARNPKAGITMWWEHVSTQIRVKGTCTRISDNEADAHWKTRIREAQLATAAFAQSQPLASLDLLPQQYRRAAAEYADKEISRPDGWGGFRLCPEHLEFLRFNENRLHARTAYALVNSQWERKLSSALTGP